MNNIYKALASAAIALLAASCVNEMGNDTTDGMFRKYNLSFEGSTKTELSGTGSTRQVKWTDGDEIKYYTVDKQPNVSTASVTADGSSAFVEIPRGRNDDFINAVYGAGSLTVSSSTSDCMCVVSPAKSDQSYTTFAQAHLCAAFSTDLEDPNLRFHNAVAVLKFTSAAVISKVVFSGNKGEVITGGSNGDLKITYSGGAISADPASSGGTSVTVTTAGQESDFYIAILPVNFTEGIIVRGYDASGYLLCERKTSGELNTVNATGLPIIANLGSIQDWLDNPKPTAVDLGLSVKWASFNVGASSPEEFGDYFSWGETAPKNEYKWSNYLYSSSKNGPFSKYVLDIGYGTVDHKTILDLGDDAAAVNWKDDWRLPSKEEFTELMEGCTWTWTTKNGVNGYKIIGTNGNSIFLPANGMRSGSGLSDSGTVGNYWSSSLSADGAYFAVSPLFSQSVRESENCYRYLGLGVRPVYGEIVPVTEITLNYTNLDLSTNGSSQLNATILPSNATYKGLIWSSSDESVATVDANGKVTAVSIGKAIITAFAIDRSGVYATCSVNVKNFVTNISFERDILPLIVGECKAVAVIVGPEEASDKSVVWSSSDESIATVDATGVVVPLKRGSAKITAMANDGGGTYASFCALVRNPVPDGAVDLGLSVHWATCNVSTYSDNLKQDLCWFRWGSPSAALKFWYSSYPWGYGSTRYYSKYVTNSRNLNPDTNDKVDNKTVLELDDDTAYYYLGDSWRMPTEAECKELLDNCSCIWTTNDGKAGVQLTSMIEGFDNSWIFLPAMGVRYSVNSAYATYFTGNNTNGYYWSSSLYLDGSDAHAWCISFNSDGVRMSNSLRTNGLTIRPVTE